MFPSMTKVLHHLPRVNDPSSGTVQVEDTAIPAVTNTSERAKVAPRVVLITPYSGGNFGDAAIQDAMIANIRSRLPGAQFSGISLNSENYLKQHGTRAFPLCASGNAF